ncbi:MAG: glycerate kinase [Thermoleophilia bacterium]|nr:glycerate kinase [Thermoleophilia bacterium]
MTPVALCAPDKLRGALDAHEAAQAMAEGCRQAGWDTIEHPLADGGEGTCDAIVRGRGGRREQISTRDAIGRPRRATLGVLPDGSCVVEAAEAIGLAQIPRGRRDVMRATSAGIAPLVLAALGMNAPRIVIGLGGSASIDGGLGLLIGLGLKAYDAEGNMLRGRGMDVPMVARIDTTGLDPRLAHTELTVALDVDSPLAGPLGAAPVFGPQKGASPSEIEVLDAGLARLAGLYGERARRPGAGAAGGLGAACFLLGARPIPGAELVMRETGFAACLAQADLVLTAEGAVDAQSAAGKTVARVAEAARSAGVPCVIFGGRVDDDVEALYDAGASAVLGIGRGARPIRQALRESGADLRAASRAVCTLRG